MRQVDTITQWAGCLIVLQSEDELDRWQARAARAGCQVAMLMTDDGDMTISNGKEPDFIHVPGSEDFVGDLYRALNQARDFQVITIPRLEEEGVLMDWRVVDLIAAECIARRCGIMLVVVVPPSEASADLH